MRWTRPRSVAIRTVWATNWCFSTAPEIRLWRSDPEVVPAMKTGCWDMLLASRQNNFQGFDSLMFFVFVGLEWTVFKQLEAIGKPLEAVFFRHSRGFGLDFNELMWPTPFVNKVRCWTFELDLSPHDDVWIFKCSKGWSELKQPWNRNVWLL